MIKLSWFRNWSSWMMNTWFSQLTQKSPEDSNIFNLPYCINLIYLILNHGEYVKVAQLNSRIRLNTANSGWFTQFGTKSVSPNLVLLSVPGPCSTKTSPDRFFLSNSFEHRSTVSWTAVGANFSQHLSKVLPQRQSHQDSIDSRCAPILPFQSKEVGPGFGPELLVDSLTYPSSSPLSTKSPCISQRPPSSFFELWLYNKSMTNNNNNLWVPLVYKQRNTDSLSDSLLFPWTATSRKLKLYTAVSVTFQMCNKGS